MMKQYITYEEAAGMCNVSVLTICKSVQDHQIKTIARHGKIYVDKETIKNWPCPSERPNKPKY